LITPVKRDFKIRSKSGANGLLRASKEWPGAALPRADLVLTKGPSHSIEEVLLRKL
jgi:hypothetical protein